MNSSFIADETFCPQAPQDDQHVDLPGARQASNGTSQQRVPRRCNSEAATAGRKLDLLKRSGMFGVDTKGSVIERACTLVDLRAAYRLVHDVFVGTGYIQPEHAGIRLRIFEASPDTATFVAKRDGVVVGVLSVVLDSPEFGLPSDAAFQPELDAMRATGSRLCEVTNQAVAKEYRRSAVLTELMRCAIAFMVDAGCDQAIATVSPNHNAFYAVVGFMPLGSLRSYSEKLHDPVVALCLEVNLYRDPAYGSATLDPFVHQLGTTANPFVPCAAEWTRQARESFLNTGLLEDLLLNGRNFLAECTLSELAHLRLCWGPELFDAVCEAMTFPVNEPIEVSFSSGSAAA